MGKDLAQSKNETKEHQKVMSCRGGRSLCRYIDFFHACIVACVPSLIRISASWGVVQIIQELVQQRDAVMRQNEAVTFKNNKQEQLLTELIRELHNKLVKANIAIDVCVETILVSLNSAQEIVFVASGQAVQERQRKDLQIKQLQNLRVADAQQFSDGQRAAVSELEDKHKQWMEAARKKSAKALEAEFGRGRKVGEADESIKNEARTKEDDKKAHDHQQEIAKQAAKERKDEHAVVFLAGQRDAQSLARKGESDHIVRLHNHIDATSCGLGDATRQNIALKAASMTFRRVRYVFMNVSI
jgi:hypothetical protein